MSALRIIKIAAVLYKEKEDTISSAYEEIVKKIREHNDKQEDDSKKCKIILESPPYFLKVNCYTKDFRAIAKKILNKYKDTVNWNLSKSNDSKKLVVLSLEPKLPKEAKAKLNKNGDFIFSDGPFKGKEVTWSSRSDNKEKIGEQKTITLVPDIWNNAFHGWKVS